MGWTEIVIAVLGIVGALDLGRLVFFHASKKKANAEADEIAITALKDAIAGLRDENTNLRLENESLRDEKIRLTNRLTALFDDMCVHKGCCIRKPHQGQGEKWYNDNIDDPSMGCDYESIYTLLKKHKKSNCLEDEK